MARNTIILILFAAIVALGLALFQYYYNPKRNFKTPALFSFLRFIAIFTLFLLLINPKINTAETYIVKPSLILAIDNSASIENLGGAQKVTDFVKEITENKAIKEQFELRLYSFGNELQQNKTFSFSEPQTKLYAALSSLNQLYGNAVSPTILITDGNQTYGRNFNVAASMYGSSIFPVVVGDTATYRDFLLSRVNVNKYSFLNNQFPVELFVTYSGKGSAHSTLQIESEGNVVYSEEITLSDLDNSKIVRTFLPASSIGTSLYEAEIIPIAEEKNTRNNTKNFAVEVIDERTSVLLVAGRIHPDLGALKKAIETNPQREVEIHDTENSISNINDYQLVIFYQPNNTFNPILKKVQQNKIPYWIITGTETDWNYLNNAQGYFKKERTGQTEEFFPIRNLNYAAFQFEGPEFSGFPPLRGFFGETTIQVPTETILLKQVQGILTEKPLLFTFGEANVKKAVLFGEGMWKWRSQTFVEQGSFEKFDDFIGNLVQYTASKQKRERLTISYDPFYYAHDKIVITAEYFDKNYQFDPEGQLTLELKNLNTQETRIVPLILKNNTYQVNLNNLEASEFRFSVSVKGETLKESGKFKIAPFHVEDQFNSANGFGLHQISENFNVPLYFLDDSTKLIKDLLSNKSYASIQKTHKNNVPLIDWYYLLGVIVLALSIEWFLRKYYGLI